MWLILPGSLYVISRPEFSHWLAVAYFMGWDPIKINPTHVSKQIPAPAGSGVLAITTTLVNFLSDTNVNLVIPFTGTAPCRSLWRTVPWWFWTAFLIATSTRNSARWRSAQWWVAWKWVMFTVWISDRPGRNNQPPVNSWYAMLGVFFCSWWFLLFFMDILSQTLSGTFPGSWNS